MEDNKDAVWVFYAAKAILSMMLTFWGQGFRLVSRSIFTDSDSLI